MKLTVKTTKLDLTPSLTNYLQKKIGSLDKFLKFQIKEGIAKTWVELARTTSHHRHGDIFYAEADIRLPGKILRAEAKAKDIRLAIDKLKDKLQKQIRKYKSNPIR